jgi:hypothetical protein
MRSKLTRSSQSTPIKPNSGIVAPSWLILPWMQAADPAWESVAQ